MTDAQVLSLSGKAILSRTGYVWMLGYGLTSMFAANLDLGLQHLAERVVIVVIAHNVLFLLLASANQLGAVPSGTSALVMLRFVAAASLRALLVALLLDVTGVTTGVDWPKRMLGSVIGFSTALALVDAGLTAVRAHKSRMQVLEASMSAARSAHEGAVSAVRQQRDEAIDSVREELLARTASLSEAPPIEALQLLREASEQVVMPLITGLDFEDAMPSASPAPGQPTRVVVAAFIRDAVSGKPLMPAASAGLFAAFGAPFLLLALPTGYALQLMASGMVIVGSLLWVCNQVMSRLDPEWPASARFVALLMLVISSVLLLAWSSAAFVDALPAIRARVIWADLTVVPSVVFALLLMRAAQSQDLRLRSSIEAATQSLVWNSTRLRCVLWRERRALARAMHGPVQGALGAATVQLQRAVAENRADADLLASVGERLREALKRVGDDLDAGKGVRAMLDELGVTWSGVCAVSTDLSAHVDDALQRDPIAGFAVRELVAEACWNAVRHGHASQIHVRLALGPSAVSVVVDDDGMASEATDHEGMGTRMLRDMTLSWKRLPSLTGTSLRCSVPLSPA